MYMIEFHKSTSEKARLIHKEIRRKKGNYMKDIAKDGTRGLTDPSGEVHKTNTRILVCWEKD